MTSNIDDRKLCAAKNAEQSAPSSQSARSADLENILRSLGHVVSESQQKSDDTLQEIGERAQEIQELAADVSAKGANDAADIFDALEDQMSELAAKIEQAPEDQADTEIVVDEGGAGLAVDETQVVSSEWDQSTADELAQIYSEIDAGFGSDSQADQGALKLGQRTIDNGAVIVGAGVTEQQNSEIGVEEPLPVGDIGHDGNAIDLENEHDQEFGAVADAAVVPVGAVDLSGGVDDVDINLSSDDLADLVTPCDEPSVEVLVASGSGRVRHWRWR